MIKYLRYRNKKYYGLVGILLAIMMLLKITHHFYHEHHYTHSVKYYEKNLSLASDKVNECGRKNLLSSDQECKNAEKAMKHHSQQVLGIS